MNIGVVVASENALPTAFAVFRGVAYGIRMAAELGYDGVELAVRDGREFAPAIIADLLDRYGVRIAAISTGQLFADRGLWLSARDGRIRAGAVEEFRRIIDMAAALGCIVNIGRARGFVEQGDNRSETAERFARSMEVVAAHARNAGVSLVLEPVNRYETNFINNVDEGAELLESLARRGVTNLRLMPDVFHMNIEDASIEGSLLRHSANIGYVHLADSNRLAPAWGHLDFAGLASTLREAGYDGWVTVECLPSPSPEAAAKQAIGYLRQFFPR